MFAGEIGVSPQLMGEWLKGKLPKSQKSYVALQKYFGSQLREVEDIGLYAWPSDELLQPIAELIAMLPEEQKNAVREAFAYTVLEGEGLSAQEIAEILIRRIKENINNNS